MNKTDLNKLIAGNLVVVWWEDITESINAYFYKSATATCRSVGWVSDVAPKNGIKYLIFASSEYTEDEFKDTGTSSAIPLDCIFKVELIIKGA